MSENLPNKPLVEAIFELRWELQQTEAGAFDPNYQILTGRFFDRVQDKYPFYEQLLLPVMQEIMGGRVQHRFRKKQNQYPLVQLGSGILTVNYTDDYIWDNFKDVTLEIIHIFYASYPQKNNLKINSISLRYINIIDIDIEDSTIYEYLKKIKINLSLEHSLFEEKQLIDKPLGLNLNLVFPCQKPKEIFNFNVAVGKRNEKDVLIWDDAISSQRDDIPAFPDFANQWLTDAHKVFHDWFFTLVSGELLESFK